MKYYQIATLGTLGETLWGEVNHKPSTYSCNACSGYGKQYDPDKRDCIEGYKLVARSVPCDVCHGTGWRKNKANKKTYKAYVAKIKKRNKTINALNKCMREFQIDNKTFMSDEMELYVKKME